MLPSKLRNLTLEEIPNLNPATGVAFRNLLQRAVEDLMDRAEDESVRKVTLTCVLKPGAIVNNPDGPGRVLEDIEIGFELAPKFPSYKSRLCRATVANGVAQFMPDSPDNPRQSTLLGAE